MEERTENSKKQGTTEFTDYADFVGVHGGAPKKSSKKPKTLFNRR